MTGYIWPGLGLDNVTLQTLIILPYTGHL